MITSVALLEELEEEVIPVVEEEGVVDPEEGKLPAAVAVIT
jgi:hypothetical protein